MEAVAGLGPNDCPQPDIETKHFGLNDDLVMHVDQPFVSEDLLELNEEFNKLLFAKV